jgi:hypothetical protein
VVCRRTCLYAWTLCSRERGMKDSWIVDAKRKLRGEVRDTLFSEGGGVKEQHFVTRFPGYARSPFW